MGQLVALAGFLRPEKSMLLFTLLAKLINSPEIEKEACLQFFNADGLQLVKSQKLLEFDNPQLLSEVLAIICQFCRISISNYESIHGLDLYGSLKKCINHADASIRAKTCNIIGHMCRHSDYFYQHLMDCDLIRDCIASCSDKDPATRKFACFALGNAAFHNEKLYQALKPAILPVISLLKDKDERTRANASGALGNFARNSKVMVAELVEHRAIDALFAVAVKDPSLNAQRVALFSLGNLCNYPECKSIVMNSEAFMSSVRKIAKQLEAASDKTYIKYAKRFMQRIN